MPGSRAVATCAVLLALTASHPHAQLGGLRDRLRDRLERRQPSCESDEVVRDGECVKRTRTVEGEPSTQAEATAARENATLRTSASTSEQLKPGEGAWANYDFVPGDTILFAEDFSADRVGNFPRRLELEKGVFEVVEWGGRRWLRSNGEGEFTINVPQPLPNRWTLEFELTIPSNGMYFYPGDDVDRNPGDQQSLYLSKGSIRPNVPGKPSADVDPRIEMGRELFDDEDDELSRPVHVRLQADGTYMKVYVQDHRLVNLPNMGRWTGNKLHFYFNSNRSGDRHHSALMTAISLNSGGAELYDALMAGGRLAVPGIYFDTGSDRIRPESSGTLAEIQQMLTEHASLKLLVEGHTDNVGSADKNRILSELRAAAVVTYLVGRGIDRARLQSAGLGDTKPAVPNDSAENRQRNRRVELVVQR